jgi:hypothetical protein
MLLIATMRRTKRLGAASVAVVAVACFHAQGAETILCHIGSADNSPLEFNDKAREIRTVRVSGFSLRRGANGVVQN